MPNLLLHAIPLIFVAFWLWMFWDMAHRSTLPECFITTTNHHDSRSNWMLAFIVLNIFAALYYFFTIYQHGEQS